MNVRMNFNSDPLPPPVQRSTSVLGLPVSGLAPAEPKGLAHSFCNSERLFHGVGRPSSSCAKPCSIVMLLWWVNAEFIKIYILNIKMLFKQSVLRFWIFIWLVAWLVPADILEKLFSVYLVCTEIFAPSPVCMVWEGRQEKWPFLPQWLAHYFSINYCMINFPHWFTLLPLFYIRLLYAF